MADIIDLEAQREKRDGPDAEFVMRDDDGRLMFVFALDYKFEGGTWSLNLWAYSQEDAEARVQAMRDSLSCAGQLYASIPQ